ncbi:MAG: nuclear transport factor 2 family protein [Planctomycetota bacterium]
MASSIAAHQGHPFGRDRLAAGRAVVVHRRGPRQRIGALLDSEVMMPESCHDATRAPSFVRSPASTQPTALAAPRHRVLTGILASIAAAVVLTPDTSAQVTGTINEDAPTASTTVDFDNGWKLGLEYTAIHYGKGRWRMLPGRESQHAEFNAMAPRTAIGTVVTNCHVVAGEHMIPPGRFDLYFMVTGHGWELHLRKQGAEGQPSILWHMHPETTQSLYKRLRFSLEPGDEPNSAIFGFAFGQHVLTMPLELRSAKYPYGKPPGVDDTELDRAEPSSPKPGPGNASADEDDIRAVVQAFFEVIASKDVAAAGDLVLADGTAHSVRRDGDKRVVEAFSFAQWLERLPTLEAEMREAFLEPPTVLIDGDVAVVWGRYAFDRNGTRSHTGIDAFTVLRTDHGWRLASALYSVGPESR